MIDLNSKVTTIIDFALKIAKLNEDNYIDRVVENVSIKTGIAPLLCRQHICEQYEQSSAKVEFLKITNHLKRLKERAAIQTCDDLSKDIELINKINEIKIGIGNE
jgi:hypothetical protein